MYANNGDTDQTPRSVASGLGLYCLPMPPHTKKDATLIPKCVLVYIRIKGEVGAVKLV